MTTLRKNVETAELIKTPIASVKFEASDRSSSDLYKVVKKAIHRFWDHTKIMGNSSTSSFDGIL